MKLQIKLFVTTALVATLATLQPAAAQVAENPPTANVNSDVKAGNPVIVTNNAASDVTSEDLSYAADHLASHVSQALFDLDAGIYKTALDNIDTAHKIAVSLENAAPQYTMKRKVQSGRIVYSYRKNDSDYYIPMADEAYTMRYYKSGPFWSDNKGLAVKKAEVVYVTLELNSKKAEKQLQKAHDEIVNKSYDRARNTLRDFNKSIVKDQVVADLPLQRARDNFYLARTLIEQQNYKGARFAISNAGDALAKAERSDEAPSHQERIKEMRAELKSLQVAVKQNNPTTIEQAHDKLQQFWDETKDWVTNKV